jgi:L-seryl-tRNA(Ser) seleniumtransferase
MAIKPPDLLNRLPSVSELLEKPPIRALAERWNRSTVAGSVRTFLDELRTDFERRTAAIPSIRELAERAARYVISRQHDSLGIAINATGQIDGPLWSSAPLAEAAMERMIALGREYSTRPVAAAPHFDELQRTIRQLTGAESAVALNNYSSAIWLTLTALAGSRDVIAARSATADGSLAKLAAAANATIIEVGDQARSSHADFVAAISDRTAALWTQPEATHGDDAEARAAEFDTLTQLAHDRNLLVIDALGAAPLIDPPTQLNWLGRSAAASLAACAHLVILRGDALVGGPACGILLGRGDLIQRVVAHPLFASCEIDPLRAAGLSATLSCYETPSPASSPLPVWQCLNTSIENLQNRAERLAAQLAHVEGVGSAIATETRSAILSARTGEGMPSYGIALTPKDANIASLEQRLNSARVPIHGRAEADRILLDLRTVLARQDKLIVDALLGAGTAAPNGTSNIADSAAC